MVQQDSIVLLTNQEYAQLHEQQAHYFTVNRDINQEKQNYFYNGFYAGAFSGLIFAICGLFTYKMIKSTIKKILALKTKK